MDSNRPEKNGYAQQNFWGERPILDWTAVMGVNDNVDWMEHGCRMLVAAHKNPSRCIDAVNINVTHGKLNYQI